MIKSNLDTLTHEGLNGWAVDSAKPTYRVPVKCVFNGSVSEIAMADQSRPDLIGPTPATDAFHGFSARTPIWSWGKGSTLDLIAIDSKGTDVLIVKRAVPAYPNLQTITNGILTVWFSLNEGGTLVGLRSAEFPHADNLVDNGQPYGRAIQIDLYETGNNDPKQPIPTEGGSEKFGPYAGGSQIVSYKNERSSFTCSTKIREWYSGNTTKWSLIRTTRLDGRTIISNFALLNEHPSIQKIMISHDWYFDPNLVNYYVRHANDKTWELDQHFNLTQERVATIYDRWEGEAGLAISYGISPATDKWYDVPEEVYRAMPRCVASGWRIFDRVIPPQGSHHGCQFTTVAKGVELSRKLCWEAMSKTKV